MKQPKESATNFHLRGFLLLVLFMNEEGFKRGSGVLFMDKRRGKKPAARRIFPRICLYVKISM